MSTTRKVINIAIGVIIMLFAGIVYGWSIFAAEIANEFVDWTKAQLTLTFTISMSFFCLGGLISGLAGNHLTTRLRLIIAAILFSLGFYTSSNVQTMLGLYISYGVLCGSGSGFVYNALLSSIPKYTPNRSGLVSGILLLGFGFSSLILGSIFTNLTSQGIISWRQFFAFLAFINATVIIIGSFLLHLPTIEEEKEEVQLSENNKEKYNYTPIEMIKSPTFWLFFIWAMLIALCGLAVISQAQPMAVIIGPNVALATISLIVGAIAVFNGLGRAYFGNLFDQLGWKKTMQIISVGAFTGTSMLAISLVIGLFPLAVIGFLVTGAAYGGSAISCAAYIKQSYGSKHFQVNLQLAILNLLPASFGGTLAGIIFDQTNSYLYVLLILIGATILSFVLVILIAKQHAKTL